jgi:hypothetical protein
MMTQSSITTPPMLAPTAITFRNPLIGGRTIISASVNDNTTIWAASYAESYSDGHSELGTVTDMVTAMIYSETRVWHDSGLETVRYTGSCHLNGSSFDLCVGWATNAENGSTKTWPNKTTTGKGALGTSIWQMTVTNSSLLAHVATYTPAPIPTETDTKAASQYTFPSFRFIHCNTKCLKESTGLRLSLAFLPILAALIAFCFTLVGF